MKCCEMVSGRKEDSFAPGDSCIISVLDGGQMATEHQRWMRARTTDLQGITHWQNKQGSGIH